MSSFLLELNSYLREPDDSLSSLPDILDMQSTESVIGSSKVDATEEWAQQRARVVLLLEESTDKGFCTALKIFVKIVETLDLYAPTLKGLQEVHAFVCDKLEGLIFDQSMTERHLTTAAYLYGQAMAMSTTTAEAVTLALDDLLRKQGTSSSANIILCILLGIERSNSLLFENGLPTLLSQVQITAFSQGDHRIPREALLKAMQVYSPTERDTTCQAVLSAVHTLLVDSLKLCEGEQTRMDGVSWACFIIENTPMLLRLDLRDKFPETCNASKIFSVLSSTFSSCSTQSLKALAAALPILMTWDTQIFVKGHQLKQSVELLLKMPPCLEADAMSGLGGLATVVLHEFEPYMDATSEIALGAIRRIIESEDQSQTEVEVKDKSAADLQAAQQLLNSLLASLGPMTLSPMIDYLHFPPSILLTNIQLLQQTATLLPNLASRIVQIMMDIIDELMSGDTCAYEHVAVLEALGVFPLDDLALAQKAQNLVLWSLDEDMPKEVVMAALQLATNPDIAVSPIIRNLTFRAAQLLLADDPHIVHVALNVLSNPRLASMLDERSCSMILLALHQSLEPSIQIVAAKLLTHLTTAHRAIVQPLAWSHIRQSLSLMDFLHSVDPTRAIIEACIISNLLPALPPSLHKKYVGPVKQLILDGLKRAGEGHTLSLIFQGLANLAKFEQWGSVQQSELVLSLFEMIQEIPKDSQHAALNAISKLLSVPTEGVDSFELLGNVQATFGGRTTKLDRDLKALISGIYGHLGTVERNPVISRDSKAAIDRETTIYTRKSHLFAQVTEVRDRHGAQSQHHVNWLMSKTLIAALSPPHIPADDRALIMEIMTSFGVLQPHAISSQIPEFPSIVLDELKASLNARDGAAHRDLTSIPAGLVFLATAMNLSPVWLHEYWMDMAEVMADSISAGEALPALRGLDIVLEAVVE